MTDWTPQTNRIQTIHLTPMERQALEEAIKRNGCLYLREDGAWLEPVNGVPMWFKQDIYRAKLAPVTQDVVPWEATRQNVMALIGEYLAEVNRLQQRPQPAATGAVTEPCAELIDLLPFLQTADDASEPQLRGLCKSLARIIEKLDAVAAAKTMCAKGGV